MIEPAETPISEKKFWIIVGVLAVVVILGVLGTFNHDAREFLAPMVKMVTGFIPN